MIIHFAFGDLGRKGEIKEQTKRVISDILTERRLLISKNKEFIPAFTDPNTKASPFKDAKILEDKIYWDIPANPDDEYTNNLPQAPAVIYLPHKVRMICFINISFKKLKNSLHPEYYGKFGIVFKEHFLKQKGIKPVTYYTEESVTKNAAIKKWNENKGKNLSPEEKKKLEKEILYFRKPASLFPSFKKPYIAKVVKKTGELDFSISTYDRYPDEYNFRNEQEYRIVFENDEDYMYFEERNIFRIITPDEESKSAIASFFKNQWGFQPEVMVFPSG
jgi:hypothetical protein